MTSLLRRSMICLIRREKAFDCSRPIWHTAEVGTRVRCPSRACYVLTECSCANTHLDLFIRGVEVSPLLYRLAIVVLELLAIAEATRHREVDQRIEFVQVVLSATRSDTGSDPFEGTVPIIPRCGAPSRDCRPPTSYLAAQLWNT